MQDFRQFDIYTHYKGGLYSKICEARHTETEEDLVVYMCAVSGDVFARPKAMFYEDVETAAYNGPRFRKVKYTADKTQRKALEFEVE